MGLDLVEIAIRIEEEFEIVIPNEAAEKMTTPRELIDYLMSNRRSAKSGREMTFQ